MGSGTFDPKDWDGVYYNGGTETFLRVRKTLNGIALVDIHTGGTHHYYETPTEFLNDSEEIVEVSRKAVRDPIQFIEDALAAASTTESFECDTVDIQYAREVTEITQK